MTIRWGADSIEAYARKLTLSLPVQGTAAEIALEATIRVDRRLRAQLGGRANLVLLVHDGFVVEADDEAEVVDSVKVLLKEMLAAFPALLPDTPLTSLVEAQFGPKWARAKG